MSARAPASTREQRILQIIETARSKPARLREDQITMAHGAGGKATQALIEGLLVPTLRSPALAAMDDAGAVPGAEESIVMSTDSFVVRPITFPGGSIGELAVNGTVNDLAVAGARPLALTLALVLEEGLPVPALSEQIEAIATAAAAAEVQIVTGDTKVVERGHADQMYICTTGIGRRDPRATLSPATPKDGDRILLSGPVGDHGVAIMLARGEFELEAPIESDTRSLWPAAEALLAAAGPALRCMRDATRGGVASVLNEVARSAGVGMLVREASVPVAPAVKGAAELLGIDPMYIANEGKLTAFVAPHAAEDALAALKSVPGCEQAAMIGEVRGDPPGMVLVETGFGGHRVMDQLAGDPLPRIC